jgi:hypothetical protein
MAQGLLLYVVCIQKRAASEALNKRNATRN